MSHTNMRKRKTRLESMPLVCYRCGTNKKSRKCRQYGNNVWCLACKGEVDRMQVNHGKGNDVPHPFAFGTAKCLCKNGRLYRRCPMHKATYLAMKNREANEDNEKRKPDQGPMIYKGPMPPRKKKEESNVSKQNSRSAG